MTRINKMNDDTLIRDSNVPLPDPRYWGSKFWFTMHTIAFFYPENPTQDEMAHAKNFFESLKVLLPCPGCASHYSDLLKSFPIYGAVTSRMNLMIWVNKIHNEVNKRIGNRIVTIDEYLLMNKHLERPPAIGIEPIVLFGIAIAIFSLIVIRRKFLH